MRTTNGGRLVSYVVKPSAGLGGLWPTGFGGGGWALLDAPGGNVVSRHAFRIEALKALIELDGLDTTVDVLADAAAHVAHPTDPAWLRKTFGYGAESGVGKMLVTK